MQIFFSAHHAGHRPGRTTCHRRLVRSRDLPAHGDSILAAPWHGGQAPLRPATHGVAPIGGHIWTVASGFANCAGGAWAGFEARETTAA